MLGAYERPKMSPDQKIVPVERHGIKLMSIGFLAGENMPVIWRGPMVGKLIQEFLGNVAWGELDYLIIDLPPGTGDAQLTLMQSAPLSGGVIVTTPQQVALDDVTRAIKMFQNERLNVPILGLIENMSYYVCPNCGHREDIFLHGGGKRAAEKYGIRFLGEIPLDASICQAGDSGVPIVKWSPDSPVSQAFRDAAGQVAAELSTLAMLEPQVKEFKPDSDFKLI
jgi:ATP-binding protein involved in chromosome partitioning